MNRKHLILAASLIAAGIFNAAASQEQLAKSIADVRWETQQTADQLKSTLHSLNLLTTQKEGNLRPTYETFCSEVRKTEAVAATTATRAKWMRDDGGTYFKSWQSKVDGIANESLRKKAQKRLDAVKSSFGKVQGSLAQANEKFSPFLSNLKDVEKSLASDVTANGVKAARGTVKNANWNHQAVTRSVDAALKEMDKMVKALSPEAK